MSTGLVMEQERGCGRAEGCAAPAVVSSATGSATEPACPVCAGRRVERVSAQPRDYEYHVQPDRDLGVFVCDSCGSRFAFPRPRATDLVAFYPPHYHAYNEDHGAVARMLVALRGRARARTYLKLCASRPVRLFDVGSGDCRHFVELQRYGAFDCGGVELNPAMAEAARARGFPVTTGTLEELDVAAVSERYDIVTMYQLVEHVVDPVRLFAQAWRLLKPGGHVLGQLPCVNSWEQRLFGRYWAGYHYPRHLQMVSRLGLRTALVNSGFADVRVGGALHLQAGLSLQNVLVGRLHCQARMRYGKIPLYSMLLCAAGPFCLLEYLCGRAGMMNFRACRPKQPVQRGDTMREPGQ
ncbi:MAG TPA: class I SAM-dependent methyltransferase [Phycisphaerae bacterium]|nr:class I SAM-dependent methyltransferase [Phycisphaerae bacterium]HNU44491.1 class I SAM-dependent methyltransferase [Phycisphaerae bacterium]